MRKTKEKIDIFIAKSPKKAVLIGIMLFNFAFVMIAAGVIAILSHNINGLKECSFWQAIYYTITMVLDAGCIDNLITDVESAGIFAAFVCIAVAVIGMILFTGAVIGYATNCISDFIESENNGKNKLKLSDHIILINWNSKGSEIMNEFLRANRNLMVVVFVPDNRNEIENEIRSRLDTTLIKEYQSVYEASEKLSFFEKKKYLRNNLPKEKITFIVREGDVASANDLDNISISKARTVIILDNGADPEKSKGNIQTIKTLIQVSEISKANENQTILVEVNDTWTEELVGSIETFKSREQKEKILTIPCNRMLGKTNAQIAITPEYNDLYGHVFLNKGHNKGHNLSQQEIPDATAEKRNIVVLGHNSNMDWLMRWFDVFRNRYHQNAGNELLHIVVIDDAESLEGHDYYKAYPYVVTFNADVYEGDAIEDKMYELFGSMDGLTTVLILSDDKADPTDADANVFTHLIYLRQHICQMEKNGSSRDKYTIIAEVLNPKNEDIVRNYGADKVIVSNRYLSRIIAQISMEETLSESYADMISDNPDNKDYDI